MNLRDKVTLAFVGGGLVLPSALIATWIALTSSTMDDNAQRAAAAISKETSTPCATAELDSWVDCPRYAAGGVFWRGYRCGNEAYCVQVSSEGGCQYPRCLESEIPLDCRKLPSYRIFYR